ncbi:MAG: hypothetical protein H7335_02875 [Massilia sp.]|nr:hypothetical protein [Massilia sp.]
MHQNGMGMVQNASVLNSVAACLTVFAHDVDVFARKLTGWEQSDDQN